MRHRLRSSHLGHSVFGCLFVTLLWLTGTTPPLGAGEALTPLADLQYHDLRHRNLRNADLHGANLSYADLRNADLYGADLSGANLCCARVKGANFTAADLSRANLSYVDLRGMALIEVTLTQTLFEHAIWTNGKRCGKGSVGKCLF